MCKKIPFWNKLARVNPKVNICENLLILMLSKLGFSRNHTTLSSEFHLRICMDSKYLMLITGKEIHTLLVMRRAKPRMKSLVPFEIGCLLSTWVGADMLVGGRYRYWFVRHTSLTTVHRLASEVPT